MSSRASGAAAVVDASVVIKSRKRGLTPAQLVEGLLSLWAAGGERCEDLAPLREDAALALLLGHGLPAPQTARDFLDAFEAAERAGIKPLDVIVEFAGERTSDPGSLQEIIERKPVGSFQDIKIHRNGEEMMLRVELATVEDPTLQTEAEKREESREQGAGSKEQGAGSREQGVRSKE